MYTFIRVSLVVYILDPNRLLPRYSVKTSDDALGAACPNELRFGLLTPTSYWGWSQPHLTDSICMQKTELQHGPIFIGSIPT